MKTFWLLWNPEGKNPPTYKFPTFESAKRAAQSMQSQIGVGTMYVLRAVGAVQVTLLKGWEGPDKRTKK